MKLLLLSVCALFAVGAANQCPTSDIMIIFDSSQSITSDIYRLMKNYAKNFVSIYNVNPTGDNVGYIIFTETIHDSVAMNKFTSLSSLQNSIETMNYYTGVTNVDVALQNMDTTLYQQGRSGVCKVVVLFTDGRFTEKPGQDPVALAEQLRARGATILAVAVEGVNGYLSPFDKDMLVKITGNPNNVLIMGNGQFEKEHYVQVKEMLAAQGKKY